MPNIKAAEKWSRQSEKRTIRNKDAATRLKTLYKKAAAGGDAEARESVESAYDKAASKGIIHPNKAARKKSRFAEPRAPRHRPQKPLRRRPNRRNPSAKPAGNNAGHGRRAGPGSARIVSREHGARASPAGIATDAIEQTLSEIAATIGLDVQVFALPTYITIAIGPTWSQRTMMMRLEPGRVSLRKIALINELYDALRNGRIDYRKATILLGEVDAQWPGLPPWLEIPALAFIAVGVALILGGGTRELIVSGAIGICTGILSTIAARSAIVARLFAVTAAFAATLIVASFQKLVGPVNIYISIIAGIVVLLPGYSLTLALHELANDFLVAGVARLGRVFSTLLALGCGAFLGLAVVPSVLKGESLRPIRWPGRGGSSRRCAWRSASQSTWTRGCGISFGSLRRVSSRC